MVEQAHRTNYFTYKGVKYGIGTKVLLSESLHYQYYNTNEAKDHLYTFITASSDGYNAFYWEEGTDNSSVFKSRIQIQNIDESIVQIVHPVHVEFVPWYEAVIDNVSNKKVHPDTFSGWLMYIVVMLVGLIFKDALIIWIVATIIFIIWLLNQYRT